MLSLTFDNTLGLFLLLFLLYCPNPAFCCYTK